MVDGRVFNCSVALVEHQIPMASAALSRTGNDRYYRPELAVC
jgi:hypothetical protein